MLYGKSISCFSFTFQLLIHELQAAKGRVIRAGKANRDPKRFQERKIQRHTSGQCIRTLFPPALLTQTGQP
jgi:hypothetical protein